MSVVDSILNFTSYIGSALGNLINVISTIGSSIINVLSYIYSILKALFLGLTSLLSPLGNLIAQVFSNGSIVAGFNSLDSLSDYIGGPAVVFIMTLFVVVLIRIIFGFVFKIIRGNDNYEIRKTNWVKGREQTWEKNISTSLDEFENGRHIFHG